jgi:hypothetical protein
VTVVRDAVLCQPLAHVLQALCGCHSRVAFPKAVVPPAQGQVFAIVWQVGLVMVL